MEATSDAKECLSEINPKNCWVVFVGRSEKLPFTTGIMYTYTVVSV